MFKVIIKSESLLKETNNSRGIWEGTLPKGVPFPTRQEAEEWLKSQVGKPGRLPEREVDFTEEIPKDEIKEIKDVVIDTDDEKPIIKKVAILKSQFTYEIKDLSIDKDYLKNEAISNRIKEYPSQFELNEALYAFFDKDESKIMEVLAKRKAIDEKYPLPQEDKGDIKNVSAKREV